MPKPETDWEDCALKAEAEIERLKRELAQRNREWCEAIDKAGALTVERDDAEAEIERLKAEIKAETAAHKLDVELYQREAEEALDMEAQLVADQIHRRTVAEAKRVEAKAEIERLKAEVAGAKQAWQQDVHGLIEAGDALAEYARLSKNNALIRAWSTAKGEE